MTAPNTDEDDAGLDPTIDHSITRILNEAGGDGVRLAESTEPSWGDAGDVDEAVRALGQRASSKRYSIEKVIAKGGMGMVFNAMDLNVRRKIAMKVMLPEAESSPDQVVRFIEEAQVTGQLEHPGIVPVYELGVDGSGNVYYTMKLIKGKTLKEILRLLVEDDKKTIAAFPLTRLLTIFQKVCDAMAYSHNKHVVHRDLKPENIMIGEYGEVHVVDWGLAKVVDRMKPSVEAEIGTSTNAMLEAVNSLRQDESHKAYATMHGQVLGTPKYMAPEQAMGVVDSIDARTDVYSLGAILYNILTLSTAVSGDSIHVLLTKVIMGEIVQPSQYNSGGTHESALPHCPSNRIPDGLSAIVMKAMATKKENRFQSVEGLQEDIYSWMNGYAPSAENAGLGKQAWLFIERHRAMIGLAASSILIIFGLLIFVAVTAKQGENRALVAMTQAQEARKEAEVAKLASAESEEKLKTIAQKTAAETWQKAMACFKSDDLEQAEQHLGVCEQLNPNDPNIWLMKGRMELLKLNLKAAKKHFLEYKRRAKDSKADEYLGILRQLDMASDDLAQLEGSSSGGPESWRGRSLAGAFKGMLAMKENSPRESKKAKVTDALMKDEAEAPGSDRTDTSRSQLASEEKSRRLKQTDGKVGRRNRQSQRQVRMQFVAQALASKKDPVLAANMFNRLGQRGEAVRIQARVLQRDFKKTNSVQGNMAVKTMATSQTLQVKMPANADLKDLTALNGLPIDELDLSNGKIRDLNQLKLPNLTQFSTTSSDIVDVAPLAQMPLTKLQLTNAQVIDFAPLEGMKLTELDLSNTKVTDLNWLAEMPLKKLILKNTTVTDISPLKGMELVEVDLRGSKVTDLSVLKDMKTLKLINGQSAAKFWEKK
jgi:serine/threonine protein kinase